MASTLVRFSAGIEDEDGIRATAAQPVFADTGASLADMATALGAWASGIQTVTDGKVVSSRITYTPDVSYGTQTGYPKAGSDVSKFGVIGLHQDGFTEHYGVDIPAIRQDALLAQDKVDITQAQLAAFIAMLATAGANYVYVGTKAVQLKVPVVYSFSSTRKYRRQQHEASLTRY